MEVTCSFEILLTFNGLHGITSQNEELFLITALRISNPTGQRIPLMELKTYFSPTHWTVLDLILCSDDSNQGGRTYSFSVECRKNK
jgi:hypothetical protein